MKRDSFSLKKCIHSRIVYAKSTLWDWWNLILNFAYGKIHWNVVQHFVCFRIWSTIFSVLWNLKQKLIAFILLKIYTYYIFFIFFVFKSLLVTRNCRSVICDASLEFFAFHLHDNRLKDLDVKFAHQFIKDGIHGPVHVNSPDWHPAHINNVIGSQQFNVPRVTAIPKFPSGLNFSDQANQAVEMPTYDLEFMDKETIWEQPLFFMANQTNGPFTSRYYNHKRRRFIKKFKSKTNTNGAHYSCVSYETLNSSPASSLFSFASGLKSNHYNETHERPTWEFKDLRPYFNHR